MIIPDEKTMTLIMAKRNPKDGSSHKSEMKPQKSMNEGGEVDGRHAAAEDAISAMHNKDPHQLMQALANFMDMHMNMPDSEEPESDL